MKSKLLSFLGIAQRSGNLISGEDTCERSIKRNEVKLIIIPEDASMNTQKKFIDMATYREIKYIVYGNRNELSAAIGKLNRTIYAIKDDGFANKIVDLLKEVDGCPNKSGGE